MHCRPLGTFARSLVRNAPVFLIAGAFALAALPSVPSVQASDIATKVQTACTTCHNLKRVCKNLGVKSKDEWTTTVNRMVGKKPVLEGADVAAAIDYLASSKAEAPEICQ